MIINLLPMSPDRCLACPRLKSFGSIETGLSFVPT